MRMEDDKLLRQFMNANRQEVADGGFSRRVMRRLPYRYNPALRLINALGVIVGVFLFLAFDGIQVIVELLRNIFVYLVQHLSFVAFDFKTVAIVFVVISILTINFAWKHVDD